jgi:hypothetical protein
MIITRDGNITFRFNFDKPRRTQGRKLAIKEYKKEYGIKRTPPGLHLHHIDLDRSNGEADNLLVCDIPGQHNNVHAQLHEMTTQMIKLGIVGFDRQGKYYFIKDNYLDNFFRTKIKGAKHENNDDRRNGPRVGADGPSHRVRHAEAKNGNGAIRRQGPTYPHPLTRVNGHAKGSNHNIGNT